MAWASPFALAISESLSCSACSTIYFALSASYIAILKFFALCKTCSVCHCLDEVRLSSNLRRWDHTNSQQDAIFSFSSLSMERSSRNNIKLCSISSAIPSHIRDYLLTHASTSSLYSRLKLSVFK